MINKIQSEVGLETNYFDLKDIIFKDNTVSIVSGTETLVIEIGKEDELNCYDGQHNIIETKLLSKRKLYSYFYR